MAKKNISQVDHAVLTEYFNWLISRQSCDVDLIIYLRTDPKVAYERTNKRGRNEETTISLDYLQGLHALHERWLNPGGAENAFPIPAPVLFIDGNYSADQVVEQIKRKKIFN